MKNRTNNNMNTTELNTKENANMTINTKNNKENDTMKNNEMNTAANVLRDKKNTGSSCRITKIGSTRLKKSTKYKFMVIAFDGDNNVLSSSGLIIASTKKK